jgi:hypothetical protein
MVTQEYWKAVRAMRESLPDVLFITSATASDDGRVAGVTFEVTKEAAARPLVDGSHRLATPQEIAAYNAEQDRKRRLLDAQADVAAGRFAFLEG